VVLTQQQKLGLTLPDILRELPDVNPIEKTEFNCFLSEPFMETLNRLDRKYLVLAGIEAHICVTQTALGALPTYGVQVVSDAVSSRAPHNRETALIRMQQHGILMTSTEMVIYELLEKAGTETFKEVLKLVK
jgi:nicotinamidase-related amidase